MTIGLEPRPLRRGTLGLVGRRGVRGFLRRNIRGVFQLRPRRQAVGFDDSGVPRLRLDAETLRANSLAIAGLLNLKQGGTPLRPPQPDGRWQKVGGQQYNSVVSPGDELGEAVFSAPQTRRCDSPVYSTNSISPGLHVLSNQGSKGP